MRKTSVQSVVQLPAIFFLLLSLFIPSVSFAQENNSSTLGLARKQEAVTKLGNRLPNVAAKYGKSPSELRRLFLQDSSLHIDKNDRLLYVEKAPDELEFAAAAPSAPQAAPYPYSQTFTLHSRPSASRKIYLDFNGHTISSQNAWRQSGFTSGVAEPFDLDSNPGNFSAAEQDIIQNVWLRMSEDFAPFDVDVTTDLSLDDFMEINGSRAVFTKTNFMGAGIGGVAYIGAFGSDEMYQPAWIFSSGFGSNDKGLAEAASHEVGHNLGLNHDGTSTQGYYGGHGVWAPIMGVGYSKSVSQWSKGEYAGATNIEDDLLIMQRYVPLIADDYGNTTATAKVLNGTSLNISGLVTTNTDVDVFRFTTGSGTVSVNINSAPRGANLDIKAQLLDSAGNVLAISDPSSVGLMSSFPAGMSASFNQFLSAGNYYLTIEGVGNSEGDGGGYSDYASIGQYAITGTLAGGGNSQQAPVAVVSANSVTGTAPLTINFSSSGSNDPDGSIVGYWWNFGDGTSSSAQNPSKVYNSAGTFTATLTVTDNSGLTGSNSVLINVTNPVTVSSIAGTISYGVTPAGQSAQNVSGVLISANGWSNASTTTGTNGSYLLGNLVNGGQYTVTPSKTGSVNGITTFDATLVMRHVAAAGVGANALNANQQLAADTNNDGAITSFDATQILRFVAANGANAGTGNVGNWKFSPAPRAYGAVSSALTNQNYQAFLIGEVNGDWSSTGTAGIDSLEKRDDSDQIEAALQQPEAEIQISLPSNATGEKGSAVTIPITLANNNTPIAAYTLEVTFDPNVLQPQADPINTTNTVSGSAGCLVFSNTSNSTNRATLRIVGACPNGINRSGTLVNLDFNVVGTANTASGTTSLEFIVRSGADQIPLFQNDTGTVPVIVTNGLFTVSSTLPGASVNLAGRILTADGRGLRNSQVRLINLDGSSKTVMSGTFGNYRFANVQSGQPVTIQIVSKRFGFQPQTVNVSGNISDLNFIAQP